MVFHWSLSDSKSPQVSRTLLSILSVLNNAVVWIISTRTPTPKSSSPFNNPLVTVAKVPITIGIIVTFIFHSFFNSLARSRYLSFFQFYSVVSRQFCKFSLIFFFFFFFLFWLFWVVIKPMTNQNTWHTFSFGDGEAMQPEIEKKNSQFICVNRMFNIFLNKYILFFCPATVTDSCFCSDVITCKRYEFQCFVGVGLLISQLYSPRNLINELGREIC